MRERGCSIRRRPREIAAAMIVRLLAILAFVCCATFARADALDDTLAKFLEDKFPQTAAAIGELAASGSPQRGPDSRSLGRQPSADRSRRPYPGLSHRRRAIIINARTGEKLTGVDASGFKKVRVNNPLRSAIEAALGALTLANPDPSKRVARGGGGFQVARRQGACRPSRRRSRRRPIRARRRRCGRPGRRFWRRMRPLRPRIASPPSKP